MSNKERHWEKTKNLMIITLIIWFIFSILIFVFGEGMNTVSFLGYPLAYYMSAQGSIIIFVVLIFWFANKYRSKYLFHAIIPNRFIVLTERFVARGLEQSPRCEGKLRLAIAESAMSQCLRCQVGNL